MNKSDMRIFFSFLSDRFNHYATQGEVKLTVEKDGFYIRFHFANIVRLISCFEDRGSRAWRKEFKQHILETFGVREEARYLSGRTQICYEISLNEIDKKTGVRFSLYRDNSDLL
jgi:hypothetical protein